MIDRLGRERVCTGKVKEKSEGISSVKIQRELSARIRLTSDSSGLVETAFVVLKRFLESSKRTKDFRTSDQERNGFDSFGRFESLVRVRK